MIRQPQFKAHLHAEIVPGEGVFLISDESYLALKGQVFEHVAPYLDGRHSADEIVDQLQSEASPAEIYYALMELERAGHIGESHQELSAGQAAFWSVQDIDPQIAASRLAVSDVSIKVLGDVETSPLASALAALGVGVSEDAQFCVVVVDDYLRGELEECNLEALAEGRPWMLLKPVGRQVWVGPVFQPRQTGCWNCLARRLRVNRSVEVFVQNKQKRHEPFPTARVSTAATQLIAYNMAATEIASWFVRGEASKLHGRIMSLDVLSWESRTHILSRWTACPSCGEDSAQDETSFKPVTLQSRRKTFTEDGGHRVASPQETIRKYEHHVSPITGAVSTLERCPTLNNEVMHVYTAGNNWAARHETLDHLRRSLRSSSCGKGMTDLQAKASGLCEALERYSGVFQGNEPRRHARLADLEGLAIHPNASMLFSERQYRQRAATNAAQPGFNYVPLPFDPDAKIDWSPVWSLTHQSVRYLPTAFCYYHYPSPPQEQFFAACSNGNAAGNTTEEAILQGFFELVERDSVALWWYNRVRRPAVDLDSFEEPYIGKIRSFLKKQNRELWVLDLTSDLSIPVFVAISRRTDQPQEQIMFGFGAHLSPRIALLRAVTELNQMLAWILVEGVSDEQSLQLIEDPTTLEWLKMATLANQPYLAPDESAQPRRAADYPQHATDDLKDDVLACQSVVEKLGMEMLVLDQTRPDIGLPVVKVIVPGLRHFWARFAPGRLYETPVALGWLDAPLTEEQLNPIPMFL
ncbi:MAG TPA: TOMM precursor leader peptide-binding protein [Pyrinomonadaceae bacterium]|nr:TOMM precursor leader peptide-binding protein [Pyrinomonadaceae bacterium]